MRLFFTYRRLTLYFIKLKSYDVDFPLNTGEPNKYILYSPLTVCMCVLKLLTLTLLDVYSKLIVVMSLKCGSFPMWGLLHLPRTWLQYIGRNILEVCHKHGHSSVSGICWVWDCIMHETKLSTGSATIVWDSTEHHGSTYRCVNCCSCCCERYNKY